MNARMKKLGEIFARRRLERLRLLSSTERLEGTSLVGTKCPLCGRTFAFDVFGDAFGAHLEDHVE